MTHYEFTVLQVSEPEEAPDFVFVVLSARQALSIASSILASLAERNDPVVLGLQGELESREDKHG